METIPVPTRYPDWLARTSFFLRSSGLKAWRLAQDTLHGLPLLPVGGRNDFPYMLAESVSRLDTGSDARERPLVLGKIHNLRLACRQIHRRVLAPGQTFSLWRQVGPPWQLRGFAQGREVREGCVIPTFGGGLCQLSGSLLEVALALDLDLVEKHSHTALPADISRDPRRDATLFWNYVDLRFRSRVPVLFECILTKTDLVVRVRGQHPRPANTQTFKSATAAHLPQTHLESCFTCRQTACSRHIKEAPPVGKTAFLLDEYQPEFARLVAETAKDGDQLLLPFVSEGGWSGAGRNVQFSFWFRVRRSLTLRWTVFRGITVAKAYFDLAGVLANIYQRRIGHDAEHLCVAQTLLPYLWRSGILGGRTFDVLMQRLPVTALEEELNMAAALYPESKTLVEFRAPRWFAEAEQEALKSARRIFTPHAQLAALDDRAVRLPWAAPTMHRNGSGERRDLIVFPGPTLARKGAYALREAVRKTRLPVAVLGPELEQPGFWRSLPVTFLNSKDLHWEQTHTVVQPALVEHWPRQLLKAHAGGTNLVITSQCGLEEDHAAGIHHVPFGDGNKLAEILTILSDQSRRLACES